jgi:serine protease Do
MNRVVGYGLVLLAAAGAGPRCALAGQHGEGRGRGGGFFAGSGAGAAGAHGSQGYLGVGVRDVSSDQIAALKLKEARGAEIILVDHDAPAGKAGLREHDVVLQLNGQAINSGDQLHRLLHDSPAGKTVVLVISRDGLQMTVTTQMANQGEVERKAWEQHIVVPEPQDLQSSGTENESSGFSPGPAAPPPPARGGNSFIGTILMSPPSTGAILEQLNAQLAQFFGASSGKGLLVRSVAANSPAAQAGMQVGDVVVRANTKPVASTSDWTKAIKNSHGQPLTVIVVRDKKEQTLTLTPDGKRRSSLEDLIVEPERTFVARLGFSWGPHS